MAQTFGQFLLQDALPDDISLDGPVTKKRLKEEMARYAKRNPQGYAQAVQRIKKVGDEVATWEGLSVGLDDIQPDYAKRDPVMQKALRDVKAAKNDTERRKILLRAQDDILNATLDHPSDMTIMARSGGRGSIAQLMKTVSSPVVATTSRGEVTPWLVTKSYAQGINPADAWVTGVESRRNAILSTGSVVEPGAVAKVVVTNMDNLVITKEDCGTTNGIMLAVDDQVADRYLARQEGSHPRNTLVTSAVVTDFKKKRVKRVLVRSPSTCQAQDGICQKCMGLDEWGHAHRVGTNVGVRSAQALTEPLTQFALNAKHGVRLAGQSKNLRGLKGFRVLTEVPKSFTEKAAIAERNGTVSGIVKAPQGGHHITVAGKRYYTPPGLKPIVKIGDSVEAGDALSEGTPMPDAVVKHKGIGEGRRYLSEALTGLYRRQGVDIDRRHTELLARKAMNHVEITDDPTGAFIRGDIVNYDAVRDAYQKNTAQKSLSDAKGGVLGKPILHYSAGTRLTPSVMSNLRREGVKRVDVVTKGPQFEPVMKSIIQTPLLEDDWMSRMSHRYLRRTLMEGAGFGSESDFSSTSPVPAYAMGAPFGTAEGGKYAGEFLYDMLTAPINRPSRELTKTAPPPLPPHEAPVMSEEEIASELEALIAAIGPPPPPAPQAAPATPEVKEASLAGRVAGGARKMLLGAPGKGVDKLTANIGDDTLKLISDAGGIESRAVELRNMKKWMPDLDTEAAGLSERGIVTDQGREFVQQMNKMRKDFLGQTRMSDMAPADSLRKGRRLTEYEPAWLDKISPGLSDHVTPEMFDQFAQHQSLKGRVGRGAKNLLFGEAPVEVLKQRYQAGGLVGRGGVFRGDFAVDPDTIRAYKRYREGHGNAADFYTPAAMEAFNKYLTIGLPAQALYSAATGPVGEGDSRAENIGGALGEVAGWSAASPFNAGGILFASPFIAAGKEMGRRLDPNYTPPPVQGGDYALQRAREAYQQSLQGSRYVQYYDQLDRARSVARQRMRQSQQQQPGTNYPVAPR
jgi:hypothetical protein